jgi:hypothetical protein
LIYGPLAREDTSAAKGRGEDGVTDRAHQWSTDPETQKDEERSGPILINQPKPHSVSMNIFMKDTTNLVQEQV